jgi:hypothetical protein
VAEADAALDAVRPLVALARAALEAHAARATDARDGAPTNGHAAGGQEVDVVRDVAERLAAMGILLRDPGRGLVDFPARAAGGRPYWLCWLEGEASVAWWHWVEDGFAGRTPVTDLPA